ncbi:glycoside hydrolase family 15 protein [Pseudorhodoplanes sinuspersici]|uniref:Trehalase n=1 Tax=Pseudorhodoplanes sinuspersici TaxID=1235591 RepID=A0A1W6ZY22_9HYPH|nr:glycoside hydrolase family 15 protein [Pseudorhodoplanes sinuspersici]ARQ02292.1 glycosyl hydrolase [Pseudorhodoplanes sinuspersici]RKE74119.1 GH15 family glucan-1,4-alpha-glucosidase [Pseudorhodoplanes sinuspersici]
MSALIEDYAMIGDCETAALVSRDGSIDWLCFPRFDSPACFAALLGTSENGRWSIRPTEKTVRISRRYRPDTLILETIFETDSGSAMLVDFMPPRDGASDIVRVVIGTSGQVDFETDFVVRFDYGRTVPWVTRDDDGTIRAIAGPHQLLLNSPVRLIGRDLHTRGSFSVREGDRVPFILTYGASHKPLDADELLASTETYWREFTAQCPSVGPWTETVKRSLITLKAMTYLPTGGIVASVTTSLPEFLGGIRNWDYRFCWLRDATITLQAFMNLGYFEEARTWRDWLVRAIAGAPDQMQIMYGVTGERHLWEWEVPWLGGYESSRPVRVGNAAAEQFQLDVYGEVADALVQARKGGLPSHPRALALRDVVMPFLEKAWRKPDEGIWEVRGERQHFTHSKVMAWVAFDRAAKWAGLTPEDSKLADRWRQVADEIHADVCRNAFDADLGSFVQAYGSRALDASLLQIPLVGFLPVDDVRVIGTIKAIEQWLLHDGFVLRYRTELVNDGLPPGEGVFLACSFWLADVYVLLGRYAEAQQLFDRLLELQNDVGLLSEEYDPRARRMLGNFPQAFSHVGLINTALNLARRAGPAEDRAESQ